MGVMGACNEELTMPELLRDNLQMMKCGVRQIYRAVGDNGAGNRGNGCG